MSAAPAASTKWVLRYQKRFRVAGKGTSVTRITVIVEVHSDWLEFEFENDDGSVVEPRQCIAVKKDVFLDSIVEELEQLSTAEAERRGYR